MNDDAVFEAVQSSPLWTELNEKVTVKASEVRTGMVVDTWFGNQLVINILPYNGPFDFVLNILEFSNGAKMSNCINDTYRLMSPQR